MTFLISDFILRVDLSAVRLMDQTMETKTERDERQKIVNTQLSFIYSSLCDKIAAHPLSGFSQLKSLCLLVQSSLVRQRVTPAQVNLGLLVDRQVDTDSLWNHLVICFSILNQCYS